MHNAKDLKVLSIFSIFSCSIIFFKTKIHKICLKKLMFGMLKFWKNIILNFYRPTHVLSLGKLLSILKNRIRNSPKKPLILIILWCHVIWKCRIFKKLSFLITKIEINKRILHTSWQDPAGRSTHIIYEYMRLAQ